MDSSFIVTLHNFILSAYVGDSQSNDITMHNKGLTVVSEPMVSEEKRHSTTTTTTTTITTTTTLTHNL